MELRRIDATGLDRRREPDAVVAPRLPQCAGRRTVTDARLRKIRVHEIEAGAVLDTVEEPQLAAVPDAVPAHVGHVEGRREAAHNAGDHVEASAVAKLFAGRKEQLVANADPQERPPAVERPADRVEESEL